MAKTPEPEAVQQTATKSGPELFKIEELKAKRKTPSSIFSGTCTAKNWGPGKAVLEAEYDTAVKEFSSAPMGRRAK